MRTIVGLTLFLCALPHAAGQETSWLKQNVLPVKKPSAIPFRDRVDGIDVQYRYTGRWPIKVRAESGGQIRIHDGNHEGWVAKSDFVLAKDAPAYFERRIQTNPNDAWAWNMHGSAWHEKKDYDKAIKDYDQAIRLDPTYHVYFNNRGFAWKFKKEYDKAIKDFDEAIRLDPTYANAFSNRGSAWNGKAEYDKAIKDCDEALRLSPTFTWPLWHRGQAWMGKKDYDRALKDLDEAVRLDPKYTAAFYTRAGCLALMGRSDAALESLQRALELGYRNFGNMSKDPALDSLRADPRYAQLLTANRGMAGQTSEDQVLGWFNTAGKLHDAGELQQAAVLYEKALAETPRLWGEGGEKHATAMNRLANLYSELGQYDKAEPLLRRGLEIREAKLGKDHPYTAGSLNNLANLYKNMGEYAKAEPLYRRSLEIREAKLGKDHPDTASSLLNLAILFSEMGQYAKAEPLYRRSLEIREAKLGKDHPDTASAMNRLANLYNDIGQYAKAEPLYRRSLEIREAKIGKDHPHTAGSLHNLANLYDNMGQYARAEPLYRRSLEIREAKLGKDHPDTASSLNKLAYLYSEMGQYDKAEPLFRRSLEIREAKLGKDHPYIAGSLTSLAILYSAMGQYDKAEPLLRRGLEIREAKLGKDHPFTAASLNWLANLYSEMGHYDKAEPLFMQSLDIRRASLGKQHPTVNRSLTNLAYLHVQTERPGEAIRLLDQARHIARHHVVSVLPILSDGEQLSFLKTDQDELHKALSLIRSHAGREEDRERAAGWLVNAKAAAQQAVAERILLARNNPDPAFAEQLRDLVAIRQEMTRLAMTGTTPGKEAQHRQRMQELTDQESRLSTRLHVADNRLTRDDPWVDLDDVRRRTPPDAILIDLVRMPIYDFQSKDKDKARHWQPARYLAVLTPKSGEVQLVDLGPAEAIDLAVREARKAIETSPALIRTEGDIAAEKIVKVPLDKLAKLILQPLRPHLDKYAHWILCPDGNLWLAPWAALPLDDRTYVVEKHRLQFVTSGRDLVLSSLKLDHKPGAPAIFADPDYDLSPAEDAIAGLFDVRAPRQLGKVQRLPGTAAEADAITPTLTTYAGAPQRYVEAKASVGAFQKLKGPKVLVLSTHGFFLPDQEMKPGGGDELGDAGDPKIIPGLENPLLRSGLLLAGCNRRGTANAQGETGVLTGLEIVGTDLRGTDLVVLSACETGLGDVRNGEGVAGLRQAFQIAGAETVVATLWQVSDRETALLMSGFFTNLARNDTKVESLRSAQLERMESRRRQFGAAHPFYWAAFTVTGR